MLCLKSKQQSIRNKKNENEVAMIKMTNMHKYCDQSDAHLLNAQLNVFKP